MHHHLTRGSASVFLFSVLLGLSAKAQQPSARRPMAAEALQALPITAALGAGNAMPMAHRLILKFHDAGRVRAEGNLGLLSRNGIDLSEALLVASQHGLSFRPLIDVDEERLISLEQRAARRSGRTQPDLAGMLVVEFSSSPTPDELERVGRKLQTLPVVEFAYIQLLGCPPPSDIAPTTPGLTSGQGFLGGNPGQNSRAANARGYTGSGMRISDCEYGWNPDHEELDDFDLNLEAGQTLDPGVFSSGFDSHGTAVAGIVKAPHNGFGMDGIAPDCELYTYPEWTVQGGFRRVSCIASAVADSSAGDVILLEMQTAGPDGKLAPAELDLAVFTLCKTASDAGVIVVAAAGNGAADLNSSAYSAYIARGSSGAVIVGAGTNNTSHQPLSFTTSGIRVDVQAWGTGVSTTGYGDLAAYGGDKNQRYTAGFGGTSSAAALVAGAVALLQEAAQDQLGLSLDAASMRRLMRSTGFPQGSGVGIGPAVDLQAALDRLPDLALISDRNGSGANPAIYSSTDFPILAGLWDSGFDTSAFPGATSSLIVANLQSRAPLTTAYGEILIGLSTPHVGRDAAPVVASTSDHSIFLVNTPSSIGLLVYTQGLLLGNGVVLTNAIDLKVGL